MRSFQSSSLVFAFLPTGTSHLNVLGFYVPDVAINMGPVPTNYNSLYDYIANQNDIDILVYDFGGEEFKPKPDRKFNPSVFTSQELEVLQQVVDRFAKIATKSAPTSELVETSHKERAWLDNAPQRKLISYKYAFELSQI